ncbi:MAG: alginate export family protein [Candidatus Omnitrophota bacterium]
MRKTLLVALLALAVMAMPAFASVQNIKVSGDIDSTFVVRDQFDLGTNDPNATAYQNFLMTQTRLRVDADLTENVSAVVALINERVWGQEEETNNDTDIDLNLAYVTLREMLYSPLTVIVGRQNFRYGNSLIVDSAGPNNTNSADNGLTNIANDLSKRAAQDAIRLVLDYNPLTVDILASKIDANNIATNAASDDDAELYGINANYKLSDKWNSEVEGYFFARINKNTKVGAVAPGGYKADTVYVPGFRVSTNPIKNLNVQTEFAMQGGNKATTASSGANRNDNVPRCAMAAQLITNYTLPFEKTAKYNPVITGVYTYVSGDEDPTLAGVNGGVEEQKVYTAWDPMFENQSGGKIYNALFDLTNCHSLVLAGSINPMEDVTLKASWTGLWLDHRIKGSTVTPGVGSGDLLQLRQPDAAGTILPAVTTNKAIGSELDFDLSYDYTEDVQIGLKMGWFFPGGLFEGRNDETAKQFLANVNVNF